MTAQCFPVEHHYRSDHLLGFGRNTSGRIFILDITRLISASVAARKAVISLIISLAVLLVATPASAVPPLGQGPGGPILLIGSPSNSFTYYYAEILRAEGLNAFATVDIGGVTASTLSGYDIVILGEMPLTSAQVSMFTTWVTGGGNLITMRPDKQLAGLLGLMDASSTLSNAYLWIDTSARPGVGIVANTLQFHGTADGYNLNGATRLATLYSDAVTPTASPAVTLRNAGSGQAAAFTYDLARSVVYTRQGNPAWAGQQRDPHSGPNYPSNLFFGAASFDPQPDWNDHNNIAIPQADEQQRLLANLILYMNTGKKPLPRFYYFPFGLKAAVVMTGDDHANGGTGPRFDQYKAMSPAGCSVANWQCVRSTSYVYPNSPLTAAQAAGYTADGFEVALHENTSPSTDCAPWTPSGLDSIFTTELGQWKTSYPGIPSPATNRIHCMIWSDWASAPKVELSHGMRFDNNYVLADPNRPGLWIGSGFPMRFGDTDGTMIDVYQSPSELADNLDQSLMPLHIDSLLDRALGPQGYYASIALLAHTDNPSSFLSNVVTTSAMTHNVPVVSSLQMLNWIDGRNQSSFGGIAWSGNTLSFTIALGPSTNGIQAMLPRESSAGGLSSLTLNGSPVAVMVQTMKGVDYAVFSAAAGNYQALYGATLPVSVSVIPSLASVRASQAQQFTATVTGALNTSVTWTASPPLGTISASGLYTAPATISAPQNVTLTATSQADSTKSASVTVAVTPFPAPPAPAAYWSMDATSAIGTVLLDKSGNKLTGTINGGVTTVTGKVNQAQNFNGVNGYVAIGNDYPLSQLYSSMTLAAWIKTTNKTRPETILSKYDLSSPEVGYIFKTDPSGHVALRIGFGNLASGVSEMIDTGTFVNNGQWHHVAAVITLGRGVQFYVDGQPGSSPAANITSTPITGLYYIGLSPYTGYGNFFTGALDEVQFFNQALTADQVLQLAGGISGSGSVAPVAVSVAPQSVSLGGSQTQPFSATVTGSTNTAVTWTLTPAVGTLSSGGLYTAPASISTQQTVTVAATSVADPTKSSSATVTLIPVSVSVAPSSVTLSASQTQAFTASVTGSTNTAVSWSISPSTAGAISSSGVYTAPATVASTQTVIAKATSMADPTKSASASITLVPPSPPTITQQPQSVTVTVGQAASFTVAASGTGLSYQWQSQPPGAGTFANISGATSTTYATPATALSDSGTQFRCVVSNNNGSVPSSAATLTVNAVTFNPIRVSAGGSNYTDPSGNLWSADSGFIGGNTFVTGHAITNTTTPILYQGERWGTTFSYQFTVPNGSFQVTLKFSENYCTVVGCRVMNVAINGQTVLTNFDIFADAGASYKADDKVFTTTVTNGQMKIDFTGLGGGAAKIDAIQIVAAGSGAALLGALPTEAILRPSSQPQCFVRRGLRRARWILAVPA